MKPWSSRRVRRLLDVVEEMVRREAGEELSALGQIARRADPFRVLVGTVLSARTRDVVTMDAERRLFARYATVEALARARPSQLGRLIYPVSFYRVKARQVVRLARALLRHHGGRVPRSYEALVQLPAVGPKTANCVLVYGFGEPAIPVDTHVHRIPNRLGLIHTKEPEETEEALRALLPRREWIRVNELFVRFGQLVCRPVRPRCEVCSLRPLCQYYRKKVASRSP